MSDDLRTSQFRASLWRINTDDEGCSRVIFSVPLSDLAEVTKLYLAIGKLLEVTVKVSDG